MAALLFIIYYYYQSKWVLPFDTKHQSGSFGAICTGDLTGLIMESGTSVSYAALEFTERQCHLGVALKAQISKHGEKPAILHSRDEVLETTGLPISLAAFTGKLPAGLPPERGWAVSFLGRTLCGLD